MQANLPGAGPSGVFSRLQTVTIQVDALEALRLCDLEGLDQDAAAQQMGVSGTFQRILYAARKERGPGPMGWCQHPDPRGQLRRGGTPLRPKATAVPVVPSTSPPSIKRKK